MASGGGVLRYLGYAALITGCALIVDQLAIYSADGLRMGAIAPDGQSIGTSEYSPVEFMQTALLLVCAAVFAWIASRDRLRRPLAIGLFSLFLLFLIREQDLFLDRYIADNFWQVSVALVVAVAGVYIWRHRARVELGWHRSWPSAGLAIVLAGLVTLIPFSQIAGHEELWKAMLGESYVRAAKLAAEELLELAGYLLMTVGSLEFLHAWSLLPQTRQIDRPRRWRKH